MERMIGTTYRILEKIGSGGGGEVYLAEQTRLNKKIVLKADRRKLSTSQIILRREVDVLKELRHPNIPQVYDYFQEDGKVYTAMDYIPGESLDKPLSRGERFSQPQVIQWAIQLLEALRYLHSPEHGTPPRGFVHSDIKPANIMKKPNGDVCLIDFNIALALGERNVIGKSPGYASPEHYGLDYSHVDGTREQSDLRSRAGGDEHDDETVAPALSDAEMLPETALTSARTESETLDSTITDLTGASLRKPVPEQEKTPTSDAKRYIIPDARSDIYSLGATLYHLLSGVRPNRDALLVRPLSEKEFTPQLVRIITKAMNPNPNLRFQSAEEMLDAFLHLRERDPRTIRLRRRTTIGTAMLAALLVIGVLTSFAGLRRMQLREQWLKLAEYSQNALRQGDVALAKDYALQAIPEKPGLLTPACTAQAQKALTDALGVYDLSDGFKAHGTLALDSAPLCAVLSDDGKTAVCLCDQRFVVFDTDSLQELAQLPAEDSALSEAVFLDDHTLLYAGADGIAAYDILSGETRWTGSSATAIALSDDHKTAAAVFKSDSCAVIYDAASGVVKATVSFGDRGQSVTFNDRYADPHDNLLALNEDGTLLAVSFSDGSLEIFDLRSPDDGLILLESGSGYSHFEGGFYRQYFAFSAAGESEPFFSVIDTSAKAETGGFSTGSPYGVQTDPTGIYIQTENYLVRIDPVTGEQTPLITADAPVYRFARSGGDTVVVQKGERNQVLLFGSSANQKTGMETDHAADFVQMAGDVLLLADLDTPSVRILHQERRAGTETFSYDPTWFHDEARISADGKTMMLFSIRGFRIVDPSGRVLAETTFPDADRMYDQQFVREGGESRLEVTYYDGRVERYDAADGHRLGTDQIEPPDPSLNMEYRTEHYLVTAPLHGTPIVCDRETGREIGRLSDEAYLTYVTETEDGLIAQYESADGQKYGELVNVRCELLATLPNLSDVVGRRLYFDDMNGNVRACDIYTLPELISAANMKQ